MEISTSIRYILTINVEEFLCAVIKDEFADLVAIKHEEGGPVVVIVEVLFTGHCHVTVGYNGLQFGRKCVRNSRKWRFW